MVENMERLHAKHQRALCSPKKLIAVARKYESDFRGSLIYKLKEAEPVFLIYAPSVGANFMGLYLKQANTLMARIGVIYAIQRKSKLSHAYSDLGYTKSLPFEFSQALEDVKTFLDPNIFGLSAWSFLGFYAHREDVFSINISSKGVRGKSGKMTTAEQVEYVRRGSYPALMKLGRGNGRINPKKLLLEPSPNCEGLNRAQSRGLDKICIKENEDRAESTP